ncbi:MAG: hypothetical protein K2J10_12665 [Muribaculaceae bacterium]|nr:hypothetical protein [Muribaculaceae bacterium]
MGKRRNLYLLPSYTLRLLALPYSCWTATQKPYAGYVCNANCDYSHEKSAYSGTYMATGIYRCSILDKNMKVCETFQSVKNRR